CAEIARAARAGTDPSLRARWIAEDQRMRGHVVGDDSACADQGKAANRDPAANHRATADRRSISDQRGRDFPVRRALQLTIRSDRAREEVVGEADVRADEDAVLDGQPFEERAVVLYLDAGADCDVCVNVGPLADVAFLAHTGPRADGGESPDACSRADARLRRDIGGGMDIGRIEWHAVNLSHE